MRACRNNWEDRLKSLAGIDKRPKWKRSTAQGGGYPTVDYAPEPDDVKWANLHIPESDRKLRTLKIMAVLLVLLVLGTMANIGANALQSTIDTEGDAADFPIPSDVDEETRQSYINAYR